MTENNSSKENRIEAGAVETAPANQARRKAPPAATPQSGMEFILDIPLEITVELGRTRMVINELLKLGQGSVIELSKLAGETLEILANQRPIARGEVVVVNDKYGVRLTEIISPTERVEKLK
jgi:flagellar motor switch protein FliN/FliY